MRTRVAPSRTARFVAASVVAALLGGWGGALLPAQPVQAAEAAQAAPRAYRLPRPITVTVQTVPPLANVRFSWDGTVVRTDAKGRVAITRPHNFGRHTLALLDTSVTTPERRYTFRRWAGQRDPNQAFSPVVTALPMRENYRVTAAFSVKFPVTTRVVDQNGVPVDPARISAVTLRGEDGRMVSVATGGTTWLDGLVPIYHKSVLGAASVSYTLHAVTIDNVNAVDAGKQKFALGASATITFTVAFHDLVISSQDAMFGQRAGVAAMVRGPDGSMRSVPFAADGTATLANLTKGQYEISIKEPGGVVLPRRLTLSADSTVAVTVVGWFDLVVIGVAGLLLAGALLVLGRSRWARFRLVSLARFVRSRLRRSLGVPAA
jgi:hypothetical protein